MSDKKIIFSSHAVKQMFQRAITVEAIKFILHNGVAIREYPDDKPYPSKLLFALWNSKALHVVCSENSEENTIIIITAYEPSPDNWKSDFVTRKK